MKKIILLLALGFFTFSATSLMAQTPAVTTQTQVVVKKKTVNKKCKADCTTKCCDKKLARRAANKKKALHPMAAKVQAGTKKKTCCAETPGKKACNKPKNK